MPVSPADWSVGNPPPTIYVEFNKTYVLPILPELNVNEPGYWYLIAYIYPDELGQYDEITIGSQQLLAGSQVLVQLTTHPTAGSVFLITYSEVENNVVTSVRQFYHDATLSPINTSTYFKLTRGGIPQ